MIHDMAIPVVINLLNTKRDDKAIVLVVWKDQTEVTKKKNDQMIRGDKCDEK